MSGIKPARRWQPAFRPFKREPLGRRLLAATELAIKGPLFGCRMCGNCLLQETAFICPMECPKGMRNGPCGGTTPEGKCYIDETRKCIWLEIYIRSFKTGRQERLLEVLPPLDWALTGTETWGSVAAKVKETGTGRFFKSLVTGNKAHKDGVWESVFKPLRQPDWWNGDSEYHSRVPGEPASELEKRLRSGEFVFATEVTPPLGSSTEKFEKNIELVKPFVTAINFTDSSSARARMSSMACSLVAARMGAEPVMQMTSRDVTRTSFQSNIIGLNAAGINNLLCITGDSPVIGPSPVASLQMNDLDSVQMLWIARRMRDEGIYLDGRKIDDRPRLFLGAAASPLSGEPVFQALRDQKKINAGAQFFQTNLIFEPDRLDPWLEELDRRGVLDKVYILAGVAPLKNHRIAEYLNSKVPGVVVPQQILNRMKGAGVNGTDEGIEIAREIIEKLKAKKGISGIHIMTLGWEAAVEKLVTGR